MIFSRKRRRRFHGVGLKRLLALRFTTFLFFAQPASFTLYIPSE
jgi:hypothetical protein